jgi:protein phosphatase
MFGLRANTSTNQLGTASGAVGDLVPAAATDTGIERSLNEDRYAVVESPSGTAWIVCDGMGGQAGGELAAQLAIDAIRRDLENMPARSPEQALRSAISEANRVIVLRRQNQAFSGMGTTIVAAMFSGRELVIGHVGDSRAYLINDHSVKILTTDHTYVQELVDSGQIAPEDALSHPEAHILTRCIGAQPGIEVELKTQYFTDDVAQGDCLLLCSDGLYSMVSDQEIGAIVSGKPAQIACRELIELANRRGGYDNITLTIVPLPRVLSEIPPIGFQPGGNNNYRTKQVKKKSSSSGPSSPVRILGVTFLLSAFAAFGAILYVLFLLKG